MKNAIHWVQPTASFRHAAAAGVSGRCAEWRINSRDFIAVQQVVANFRPLAQRVQ